MRIIISHVYSVDNKGDAALLSVLLQDVRRAFPEAHITILSLDDVSRGDTFEGVPVQKTFMYYARDRYRNLFLQLPYTALVAISTTLWALSDRFFGVRFSLLPELQEVAELYRESDLVIPIGGGYIRSNPGLKNTVRLFFTLHALWFPILLRKPVIAYTQSVGPFGTRLQEYMTKITLRRLNGIIVREDISLALLKRWGGIKVFSSVDSGFAFSAAHAKDVRQEFGIAKEKMLVGITVRKWLPYKAQRHYERAVAKLADYIIEKYNAAVIFIPQVTAYHHYDDDRESGRSVWGYMVHKDKAYLTEERYDHHTIKAMYESLDYLVGTRFHSVIFALTAYVPAIAIGYEYKAVGVMSDLSLEEWVLNIENVRFDMLSSLFDELVERRESYIAHLREVLPPYIARAQDAIYIVKNLYEEAQAHAYSAGQLSKEVTNS